MNEGHGSPLVDPPGGFPSLYCVQEVVLSIGSVGSASSVLSVGSAQGGKDSRDGGPGSLRVNGQQDGDRR